MRTQVGLLFVLLDEEPIGTSVDAPVDVPDVVTGDVRAVVCELDTEALVGALVQSADEPLDDVTRPQLEALDLAENLRLKVFC